MDPMGFNFQSRQLWLPKDRSSARRRNSWRAHFWAEQRFSVDSNCFLVMSNEAPNKNSKNSQKTSRRINYKITMNTNKSKCDTHRNRAHVCCFFFYGFLKSKTHKISTTQSSLSRFLLFGSLRLVSTLPIASSQNHGSEKWVYLQ